MLVGCRNRTFILTHYRLEKTNVGYTNMQAPFANCIFFGAGAKYFKFITNLHAMMAPGILYQTDFSNDYCEFTIKWNEKSNNNYKLTSKEEKNDEKAIGKESKVGQKSIESSGYCNFIMYKKYDNKDIALLLIDRENLGFENEGASKELQRLKGVKPNETIEASIIKVNIDDWCIVTGKQLYAIEKVKVIDGVAKVVDIGKRNEDASLNVIGSKELSGGGLWSSVGSPLGITRRGVKRASKWGILEGLLFDEKYFKFFQSPFIFGAPIEFPKFQIRPGKRGFKELANDLRKDYVKALDKTQAVCHLFDKQEPFSMMISKDSADGWEKIDLRDSALSHDDVAKMNDGW